MSQHQLPIAQFITDRCKDALRCHAAGDHVTAQQHLQIARAQLDNLADHDTHTNARKLVDAVDRKLASPLDPQKLN